MCFRHMKDNRFLKGHIPKNRQIRTLCLLIIDSFIVSLSAFFGLLLRFDLSWDKIDIAYRQAVLDYLPFYIAATLAAFFVRKLYATMWSVAGVREALNIVATSAMAALIQTAGMMFLQYKVPRSYYILSFAVLCAGTLAVRLSYRIWLSVFGQGPFGLRNRKGSHNREGKRILIAGAGTSGAVILKEIHTSPFVDDTVVCFVDDDKNKVGKILNGVPVEGSCEDIPWLAKKYRADEIDIAMPSATAQERKRVIEICRETDCKVRILPGIYQFLNDEVSVSQLREVQIEDLLGREPIRVNLDEILDYVSGKVVLVTGGGGSIGSELCRQIAGHKPKQLVIFDVYENNAYDIQQELKEKYPDINEENIDGIIEDEIGEIFKHVLEDAGVYKRDEKGQAAFRKFINSLE